MLFTSEDSRIEADLRGSEGYLTLAFEGLVVALLLEFGVVDLPVFGVVDLLDIDPVRESGNLCGETVRFSISDTY